MKKTLFLVTITISLLAVFGLNTKSTHAAKNTCTTIQSGSIVDSDNDPITMGNDIFGYNYQAQMFNGRYCDYDRVLDGNYCEVDLAMKWNSAWLDNQDCDNDGKLDRHYALPTYRDSGAWLTNHQKGDYGLMTVDSLDIGDTESEGGHNLVGWSDIWSWGGNYGGGDDGFRLLMGPGDGCGDEYRDAYFTMDTKGSFADKIILRHLDGSQNDNFDIYLHDGTDYQIIGNYESQSNAETWVDTSFEFSPRRGVLSFKIVATGEITSWCSTWGQVAFSNVELEGIYYWDYFVKIVAMPSSAVLYNNFWYTDSTRKTEIGPYIWTDFAIIQEVSNDPYANQHGLLYKGIKPGLGSWSSLWLKQP